MANQKVKGLRLTTFIETMLNGQVSWSSTGKGLRHGFGVAMVTAKKPLPMHILSQLMGHSDTKTTEIYLQVVGEEKHQLVEDAWEG
jgi:integrase